MPSITLFQVQCVNTFPRIPYKISLPVLFLLLAFKAVFQTLLLFLFHDPQKQEQHVFILPMNQANCRPDLLWDVRIQ